MTTIVGRVQQRRGTAEALATANEIPLSGELIIETDTLLYKVGDGVSNYNDLAYKGLQPVLGVTTLEAQSSEPSAPTTGLMRFYSKDIAGRLVPKFRTSSGLDSAIQPALFGSNVQLYCAGTTTAPTVFGGPPLTNVGTVSHPALSATNQVTQTSRWILTSAATANSASESRIAATRVWRGSGAGLGGFFHRTKFSIESTTALQRMFIGFSNVTTAIATTQVISTLTNIIGIGFDSSETEMSIYVNDASGTATKIGLGANFPSNSTSTIFDFTLFCPPNASSVFYQVTNMATGAVATGELTTDLPANTTFLAYHAYMNNGGTAAAVILGLARIYTETDL
jgi:hypothetical protein